MKHYRKISWIFAALVFICLILGPQLTLTDDSSGPFRLEVQFPIVLCGYYCWDFNNQPCGTVQWTLYSDRTFETGNGGPGGIWSYSGGIYEYQSGSFLGYHAAVVVGWNDDEEYLIGKNSWGTGWGEDGYFRIAYSMVGDPKINFGYQSYYYGDVFFAYPVGAAISTPNDPEGLSPYTVSLVNSSTGSVDSVVWVEDVAVVPI